MSHNNLVHDVGGTVTSPPNSGVPTPTRETDLAPELKDALIARAKEIIAGRIEPPALVATPEIERFLRREFAECEPPPTPEALRRITERLCLESQYEGRPVLCFTTQTDNLVVLASGEREIVAVFKGLSDEEKTRVIVHDTESC